MDVIVETNDNVLVVAPRGRLDSAAAPAFEQRLLGHLDTGERGVVLDLTGLDYISSAGLRVLLVVAKRLRAGNRRFVVCALRSAVREVFELSGFTAIFEIRPTVADGLACFRNS
jgi:anti-anti-sigma factor